MNPIKLKNLFDRYSKHAASLTDPVDDDAVRLVTGVCEVGKRNISKKRGLVYLGFVQGVLWTLGQFTAEQLDEHTKDSLSDGDGK